MNTMHGIVCQASKMSVTLPLSGESRAIMARSCIGAGGCTDYANTLIKNASLEARPGFEARTLTVRVKFPKLAKSNKSN